MVNKILEIRNATGLHARPAANFVKIASALSGDVFLEKDGKKVNAKSMLGILSLGICKGNQVNVIVNGEDEEMGLEKIVAFIVNLDE